MHDTEGLARALASPQMQPHVVPVKACTQETSIALLEVLKVLIYTKALDQDVSVLPDGLQPQVKIYLHTCTHVYT